MKWLCNFSLMAMVIFQNAQAQEVRNITQEMERVTYFPPEGVVRNEKMAIAIAEIVLSPVYGKALIKKERPFIARLVKGEIWFVVGSFNEKGSNGGVAQILIRKKDGAIMGMAHEQ